MQFRTGIPRITQSKIINMLLLIIHFEAPTLTCADKQSCHISYTCIQCLYSPGLSQTAMKGGDSHKWWLKWGPVPRFWNSFLYRSILETAFVEFKMQALNRCSDVVNTLYNTWLTWWAWRFEIHLLPWRKAPWYVWQRVSISNTLDSDSLTRQKLIPALIYTNFRLRVHNN